MSHLFTRQAEVHQMVAFALVLGVSTIQAFFHPMVPLQYEKTFNLGTLFIQVGFAAFGIYRAHHLLSRIHYLEGIISVCSYCKRIRARGSEWVPFESYISERSAAVFSHGICPHCLTEHFPDYHPQQKG